ncbi:TetR/AcrR family transcriptional regulator [Solirubrobacter soli]|uniref:TetR/AcrR family transcriptional regulator n=1 Tax=Solirubrobacter soli TaxID=363832 RepID=UPI00047FD3BE|nr:TetR/AcrR family transcriptional regulator [Solirubrobacter soli]
MPRPANPRVRDALLEAGGRLFHERGYNGAGVKEIVDSAGVPKGSFYSYFDSKETLLVDVVERYWDDVEARHGALLHDDAVPPLERVSRFFAAMADDHELRDFTLGCLLGGMALEMSNVSDRARTTLTGLFGRWEDHVAAVLEEAQTRGELAADRDVRELASALIEAWEGAALRGKVAQERDPYERFERVTLPLLLRSS